MESSGFRFLENFNATSLLFVYSVHIVVRVLCTHYCLYIVYTLPLGTFAYVAFSLSISFILLVFDFVAFVYCLM